MHKCCKIFVLFAVISLFSIGEIFSQSDQYRFRHLTTNDGLPSNNVSSILKDRKGFMWFGTENGLARYDGYNIKTYQILSNSKPGERSQEIENIFEDRDRNLWIGTYQNGLQLLNRINDSLSSFIHNPDNPLSISSNRVNTIFQDKEGILWIGTYNGLNEFDHKNKTFYSYKQNTEDSGNPTDQINAIFEDKIGNFWVGTADGLYLFNRENKTFKKFDFRIEIPPGKYRRINSIMEDSKGNLWIGSNWGILKYDKDKDRISNYLPYGFAKTQKKSPEKNIFLSNLFVMSIIETNGHDKQILWIATRWRLNKFDSNDGTFEAIYSNYNNPEGISTNSLTDQCLDDAGYLWIASSDAGISIINTKQEPFHQVLITPPGTTFNFSAACFLIDQERALWIGAIDGGVFQYDSNFRLISRYKKWGYEPDKPQNNRIDCIYEDSDKNLWLGFLNGD